jgi:hypothetical protein
MIFTIVRLYWASVLVAVWLVLALGVAEGAPARRAAIEITKIYRNHGKANHAKKAVSRVIIKVGDVVMLNEAPAPAERQPASVFVEDPAAHELVVEAIDAQQVTVKPRSASALVTYRFDDKGRAGPRVPVRDVLRLLPNVPVELFLTRRQPPARIDTYDVTFELRVVP